MTPLVVLCPGRRRAGGSAWSHPGMWREGPEGLPSGSLTGSGVIRAARLCRDGVGGGLSLGAGPGGRGCRLPFVQLRGLHLWPPHTPTPGMGRGRQASEQPPAWEPRLWRRPVSGCRGRPAPGACAAAPEPVLSALPWLSGRPQSPAATTPTCRCRCRTFPSPEGGPSGPGGHQAALCSVDFRPGHLRDRWWAGAGSRLGVPRPIPP